MPNLISVKIVGVRIHHCKPEDGWTEALIDEDDLDTLKKSMLVVWDESQDTKECPSICLQKDGVTPKNVWASHHKVDVKSYVVEEKIT